MRPGRHNRTTRRFGIARLSLLALLGFACQSQGSGVDIGGETHFLKSCSPEENTCGDGLSCVCGVCTTECGSDQCKTFPGATCVSHSGPEVCGGATRVERCDVECDRDTDCSMVSAFHICREGVCRTEAPTLPSPETTEQSTSSGARDAAIDTPDAQTSAAPVSSTSSDAVTSGVSALKRASVPTRS
jgi:polyhydroxybutyrate depolymerase